MKPYPDYGCLYRVYSIVAQNGGATYKEVALYATVTDIVNAIVRIE